MGYKISVDTGGTFTDVVVSDAAGGLTIGKALTTPARIFDGMRDAIAAAAEQIGLSFPRLLADADFLIYGTTRATNAVVTKTVAKTAFLTTRGFPDTLVLKEGGKFRPHDFSQAYPEPYIPRRYVFEIDERVNAAGAVARPLDREQVRRTLATVRARGFEAVAVCFLWSVLNPAHEDAVAALIEEHLPGVPYSLSSRLIPIMREYRRASATAIDASLKPLMQRHLQELETDLKAAGYRGDIFVSTAAGGCNSIAALVERPIFTIGSGPAMAPVAGITYSRMEGLGENVIICDTGGTTFDVGVVRDGALTFNRDTWLGPRYTGDLLGIAAVDMRSIGAGGGSIAWLDDGGLMHVGPQSAGAVPGPACYGRGGAQPTVSDAAAVLGYFDPAYFLGGRMTLDVAAARAAMRGLAEALGLSIEVTAWRILTLAGDLMMRAVADVTINEGINPRDSTIVAGGGAAGMNIMLIAKELGCDHVVLPKTASALSAAGMQYADIVAEEVGSLYSLSDRFDFERVNALLERLEARVLAMRDTVPGQAGAVELEFYGEARYQAQVWELDTPFPDTRLASRRFAGQADLNAYVQNFHDLHERIFAVKDPGSAVETVSWKVRLVVKLDAPVTRKVAAAESATPPVASYRPCFFGDNEPVQTPIYKASDLSAGHAIAGPAVIEEPNTTLVVYPGMSALVSAAGHYRLNIH
ncbi:hydantoinase/oxoprolinase family protein [Chelatococcus reniformis]|uniref:5-oxoprolinase n=1 Tax=Chelatococcus reniformis TaxID=1494448 RepID=A0A916X7I6_9HYPH|nr:hydantoinase/oxoprolinase family protein [Chelatococcus reniformis]GGC45240.1 5-oxoprolinase [Chelatococcus reniformis]